MRKNFYFEGDRALEQVIKKGCGISFSRGVQNLQGCDSVQLALSECALAAGLD